MLAFESSLMGWQNIKYTLCSVKHLKPNLQNYYVSPTCKASPLKKSVFCIKNIILEYQPTIYPQVKGGNHQIKTTQKG